MISDVKRVISNETVIGKKVEMIVIPSQVTVRLACPNLFEDPFLAGFEDARRSQEDFGFRISDFDSE